MISVRSFLDDYWQGILHLLYPQTCGACGDVFVSDDKFIIPIIFDPYQADEDWIEYEFKVISEDDEYTIGSYEYLSSIEFKEKYYTIMRLL